MPDNGNAGDSQASSDDSGASNLSDSDESNTDALGQVSTYSN